jgi:bifunctional oligoribonuclease and PAP phosphatase NrnA
MPIDWRPFVDLVRRHQRFLLTTHIRPDGDAIGSMLALADALKGLGKSVRTVVASRVAARYRFLDPEGRVEYFEPPGDAWRDTDVAVVLDTSAWAQLGSFGPFFQSLPVAKAVIDHHQTQDDLGAQRLVDTTAEATGRLVFEALAALEVPLSPAIATDLFVALAMDTGWFRHSNTSAATFALAGKLVAAGARPEVLYDLLFEQNTLGRLKLTGLVLDRLQVTCQGLVAYTEIRRGDYEATGATPADSEDLVNYTRSLAGVEVGLFFMEQPRGGIKVSFRSRSRVDVARVAERFGGGGHRLAAGATLAGSLDEARARVLDAVAEALSSTP